MEKKQGKLRIWNDEKGYGLIIIGRFQTYFLHATSVIDGPERLSAGMLVTFEVGEAFKNGRYPQAVNAIVDASSEVKAVQS